MLQSGVERDHQLGFVSSLAMRSRKQPLLAAKLYFELEPRCSFNFKKLRSGTVRWLLLGDTVIDYFYRDALLFTTRYMVFLRLRRIQQLVRRQIVVFDHQTIQRQAGFAAHDEHKVYTCM